MKLRDMPITTDILKSISAMIQRENIQSSLDEVADIMPLINYLFDLPVTSVIASGIENRYKIFLSQEGAGLYSNTVYAFSFKNMNDESGGSLIINCEEDGSMDIQLSMESDFLLPILHESNEENVSMTMQIIGLEESRKYFSEQFAENRIMIYVVA